MLSWIEVVFVDVGIDVVIGYEVEFFLVDVDG